MEHIHFVVTNISFISNCLSQKPSVLIFLIVDDHLSSDILCIGFSMKTIVLFYAMLCYAMLCYAMLCYAIPLAPLQSELCQTVPVLIFTHSLYILAFKWEDYSLNPKLCVNFM